MKKLEVEVKTAKYVCDKEGCGFETDSLSTAQYHLYGHLEKKNFGAILFLKFDTLEAADEYLVFNTSRSPSKVVWEGSGWYYSWGPDLISLKEYVVRLRKETETYVALANEIENWGGQAS